MGRFSRIIPARSRKALAPLKPGSAKLADSELADLEERLALAVLATRPARPVRAGPPGIARFIQQLARRAQKQAPTSIADLQRDWASIVGEGVARRTWPTRLVRAKDGNRLKVIAQGAAATLLEAQAPQLIQRINLALGDVALVSLQFEQGVLPARAAQPAPVQEQASQADPPMSPQQEAQVRAQLAQDLSGIDNPVLKQALTKLGLAVARVHAQRTPQDHSGPDRNAGSGEN